MICIIVTVTCSFVTYIYCQLSQPKEVKKTQRDVQTNEKGKVSYVKTNKKSKKDKKTKLIDEQDYECGYV